MTSSGPGIYAHVVGARINMSLAIAKIRTPAPARPASHSDDAGCRLEIAVVFTSIESTLAALKEAGRLASSLGARITLLVPQVVPHPLPLENPPVSREFSEGRFRVIGGQSPVETRVHIYLCRDRFHALREALAPRSIVILGGRRRRWWPARDQVLAAKLRRAGFEVIYKETK